MPIDVALLTSLPRGARWAATILVVVAATCAVLVGQAQPAHATSYRFWSYWTGGDSGWSFATIGPARTPADGSVEGWRFAISAASSSATAPRASATFASVCGSTAAVSGSKRVALVVDFGTTSDAPAGDPPPAGVVTHCAVIPPSANGYAVLDDLASLRVESGLVCAINGYPARDCGEPVSSPPTDDGTDGGDGSGNPGSSGGTPSRGPRADNGDSQHTADANPSASSSESRHSPKPGTSHATPRDSVTQSSTPVAGDASPVAAVEPPSSGAGSPAGAVVGIVFVAALALTALVVSRRRRPT